MLLNGSNGRDAGSQDGAEDLCVALSSPSADVFTQDFLLLPRTSLQLDGSRPAKFELTLASFTAVEATMKRQDEALVFTLDVRDSKICPGPEKQPWSGSCVELFFSSERTGGIRQFFLVPILGGDRREVTGAHILDRARTPVPGARGTALPRSAGYMMEVTLPLEAVGVSAQASTFLFDMLATLTALGEAHSGGRAMLNHAWNSSSNSDHYTKVIIAPPQ